MAKFCKDCGLPASYHIQTWIGGLLDHFLPSVPPTFLSGKIEKLFVFLGLASWQDNFTVSDIQLRSTCFINEARQQGITFQALYGPFGYTGYFRMQLKGKTFYFEGLPLTGSLNKKNACFIDDKELTKQQLKKGGFPVVSGKSFWFFQKKKASAYAAEQLGFPVVVKPRGGSVSRHVTTNISDSVQLKKAMVKAIVYAPTFIIERFIGNASVFRATVVDFNYIACVQQLPANVIGDGQHSIRALMAKKNNHSLRGHPHQKEFILCKLVVDKTTADLLGRHNYTLATIPKAGEVVYLQKDPFLKLGGDLTEVTAKVQADNLALFRDIAKFFDMRLVGLDFLARDISVSWKNQPGAVLELNSLPCIEMHHFPSSGKPQNVAREVVTMVLKHYL